MAVATDAARADTFSNVLVRNALLHAGQSVDDNLNMPRDSGEIVASRLWYDVTMRRDVRAFNLVNRCSERPS
jgi:hypothetical protein